MLKLFDINLFNELFGVASNSKRKRQNYDLRNTACDTSQRMLNALLPGTEVPVHCHENTSETVVCLCGKLEEIFYEKTDKGFQEISRYLVSPEDGLFGIQIPAGVWHTINVMEPSVIFEAKDGAYKV